MHSRPNSYAIAPMMGWSTQHFRYWLSLLLRDVDIYTEMITANALVFGDHTRLLADCDPKNRVFQLGGSDPGVPKLPGWLMMLAIDIESKCRVPI